jgi:putative exporter of polyketide antibiotics
MTANDWLYLLLVLGIPLMIIGVVAYALRMDKDK